MGLGTRVNDLLSARATNRCGVNRVYQSIASKKEAEEFITYINDRSIQMTVLAQACQAEGYDITTSIIRHHRAGKCLCEKGK